MKKILSLSFFLFLVGLSSSSRAQGIAIGEWRDHLPYQVTRALSDAGDKVYCAGVSSVFYYDKNDASLNRLSTVNGLSDVEVSTLKYNPSTGVLVIAYLNGNIDLLLRSGEIINVAFIKKSDIVGNKTINRIDIEEELAFLSCGFGIVVFDTRKKEIRDTYFVGEDGNKLQVHDVIVEPDTIYAATEAGVYKGPRNANLADYRSWIRDKGLPKRTFTLIANLGDSRLVNERGIDFATDTVYRMEKGQAWAQIEQLGDTGTVTNYDFAVENDELMVAQGFGMYVYDLNLDLKLKIFTYADAANPFPRQIERIDDYYWVADAQSGLLRLFDNYNVDFFKLNSPDTERVFDVATDQGTVWTVAGGYTGNFGNTFYFPILGRFENQEWKTISRHTQAGLDSVYDLISVAIDPANSSRVFAGSWGAGLLELNNGELTKIYDRKNSAEHSLGVRSADNATFVGGLTFDDQSNLWVCNAFHPRPLSVLTPSGEWKSFNLQLIYNSEAVLAEIMADRNNNIWMIQHRDGRIIVYNHNGTPLDESDDPDPVVVSNSEGSGNLPGDRIYCAVEDLNGEVWIGSNKGIAVFYNPAAIFTGNDYDAQRILIQQDGTTQYLLETEAVTAIAIDGANRKWIGTQNAGVFLMSADGTEEVLHFSTDNSPIFSNNIRSISIDHETGEVFIGTEKGLISYRGTATAPVDEVSDVSVFPNPVLPGYNGVIAIKGLANNTTVKITDAKGSLVNEMKALGGQAIWNGKNFEGERVVTGVYLIFSTNPDGEQTDVSKVMILN
jgi:hypothetical protein